MNPHLREEMIDFLREKGLAKEIEYTKKIEKTIDISRYAISSDGIYYDKVQLFQYLKENKYELNQANIDLAAKMFPVDYSELEKTSVVETVTEFHDYLSELDDEDLKSYFQLVSMKQKFKNVDYLYEYTTIILKDRRGATNSELLQNTLNQYARQGWRLVSSFVNELGKNAVMVGNLGTNSTVDEVVLILERKL